MDKRENNIGLCFRAGYVVVGENLVVEALRKAELCYIFLANDAGANTTKKIRDKAKFYNVEVDESFDFATLSKAIGKENKKVLGIKKNGVSFLKILRK